MTSLKEIVELQKKCDLLEMENEKLKQRLALCDAEKKLLHEEIASLKALLAQNEKLGNDPEKEKEFFGACYRGEVNSAQTLLLSKQVDVNAKYDETTHGAEIGGNASANGTTGLIFAAMNGHVDVVRMLLQFKANPDLQNEHGQTALHLAVRNGLNFGVIKLLCQDGHAKLDVKDSPAQLTPLMRAAFNDDRQIVEYLLQQGANVNERDIEGMTALSWTKNDSVKELLKQYGATDV